VIERSRPSIVVHNANLSSQACTSVLWLVGQKKIYQLINPAAQFELSDHPTSTVLDSCDLLRALGIMSDNALLFVKGYLV
jgi:hypothetical protein